MLRLSGVLIVAAPICVVALHVVSPDLEPRSRRLSEYANGPHGYLMTLAFLALGIGLLMLTAALHSEPGRRWVPRHAPVGVAIAGAGMVMSGLVATDPDPANSMREEIHSLASGLASVALVVSALLWMLAGLRVAPRLWRPSPIAAACAVAATALAIASPWLHRSSWTGLSQRALWLALLGWLLAVVRSIRASPASHVSGGVSAVSAREETIDA